MRETFDAYTIEGSGVITAVAPSPFEGFFGAPLLLRLYVDSPSGKAVSPMMSALSKPDGSSLFLNGKLVKGTLCFFAKGKDYIWTGLHYWTFLPPGLVLLLTFYAVVWCGVVWCWFRKGHSYVVNALIAMNKYRFLVRQLVSRDFKIKYKRSVLGVFWSFLNPLLTMIVQYVVFSTIFQSNIPNYLAYLLVGIVFFNFFQRPVGWYWVPFWEIPP